MTDEEFTRKDIITIQVMLVEVPSLMRRSTDAGARG